MLPLVYPPPGSWIPYCWLSQPWCRGLALILEETKFNLSSNNSWTKGPELEVLETIPWTKVSYFHFSSLFQIHQNHNFPQVDIRAISVETEFLSLGKRWDLYTSAVKIIPESLLWSFTLRIYTAAFLWNLPPEFTLEFCREKVFQLLTSNGFTHLTYSSRKVTINIVDWTSWRWRDICDKLTPNYVKIRVT